MPWRKPSIRSRSHRQRQGHRQVRVGRNLCGRLRSGQRGRRRDLRVQGRGGRHRRAAAGDPGRRTVRPRGTAETTRKANVGGKDEDVVRSGGVNDTEWVYARDGGVFEFHAPTRRTPRPTSSRSLAWTRGRLADAVIPTRLLQAAGSSRSSRSILPRCSPGPCWAPAWCAAPDIILTHGGTIDLRYGCASAPTVRPSDGAARLAVAARGRALGLRTGSSWHSCQR